MFKFKKAANELDVDIRFLLANERTLLAWVRTGLTLIAAGVAAGFISTNSQYGTLAGMGAVAFGGLLAIVGYVRYRVADAAIRSGLLPPTGIGSLIVVIGVALFAAVLLVSRELNVL